MVTATGAAVSLVFSSCDMAMRRTAVLERLASGTGLAWPGKLSKSWTRANMVYELSDMAVSHPAWLAGWLAG